MSGWRPERTGPTVSTPCDWNTAAKRVAPSLMISSNTMSAELSPVCGRAGPTLSILTACAGRCGISLGSATGTPVSGMRSTSGSVVVVGAVLAGAVLAGAASVVVVLVVVLVVLVGASV